MALLTSTNPGAALSPTEAASFIFDRLVRESVANQISTTVQTSRSSLTVPRITADPSAAWVAEGGTITPSDPAADPLVATPRKLASLVVTSNETITDSEPSVLDV